MFVLKWCRSGKILVGQADFSSPPDRLSCKVQETFVSSACIGAIFWVPAPWGLGVGPKGQISLNLNYSQFQRFLNQTLCIFSRMKYITYQTGFSFDRLGHAQGGTWGVPWGVKKIFFPKFKQIWCVSYSHEWHMHRHKFLGPSPLGPWGGVKNSIF